MFIVDGVGYAAARPGHLEALYVVPDAWGTGVAGRPATLWVLEANERGRRFWERLGWRATGKRDEGIAVELEYEITDDPATAASS